MLQIKTDEIEIFDEETSTFDYIKPTTLKLEHSLISVSRWEAKWNVPFLDNKEKTNEQLYDYISFMSLNPAVDDRIVKNLSSDNLDVISSYINAPMTATTFNAVPSGGRSVVTSELIYYWMVAFNIPFECEKWHLNRLLTLIRICDEKNKPPKKMGRNGILSQNRALNEARRAKLKSKG